MATRRHIPETNRCLDGVTGAQGFASLVIFIPGAGCSHLVFDLKFDFEQGHREAALFSEAVAPYLKFMSTAFAFCLPTAAKVVPAGPDWVHEIKYDGYRLRVERNGKAVRLFTRNGHDWTRRFPWIVEAALKNREQQFVIDGEAVVLGVDGVSDFNALHSRRHDDEVQLYAFDVIALGGEDLRPLPLTLRKINLARLLRGRPDGMFVAPFEPAEIGADLFAAACRMGLEGLVSKRRDRRYGGGRSKDWIKVKNRTHPAMMRVMEAHK